MTVRDDLLQVHVQIMTPNGVPMRITVKSDDASIVGMIERNWTVDDAESAAVAQYYCLRGAAADANMPKSADGKLCSLGGGRFAACAVASYAQVKVHLRGIASAMPVSGLMFVHGCTLELQTATGSTGILILGASGAGKTTLVAGLVNSPMIDVRIVNDDWGPVDLSSMTATYTGERLLHMKKESMEQFVPDIDFAKNTTRDPSDKSRAFVSKGYIFGEGGGTARTRLEHVIVVRRDGLPGNTQVLSGIDLSSLEAGDYSPFYRSNERFLNGALLLESEEDLQRHRENYRQLTSGIAGATIYNQGTRGDLIANFLQAINM